jgi:hypothetical protein
MSYKVFLSIIIVFLLSVAFEKEKQPAFTADTFTEKPPEIDGCSCYFGEAKEGFEKKQYIYMDDFQNLIILKINGKFVKFEVTDKKETKPNKEYLSIAESEKYSLSISTKYFKRSGDEVWLYRGSFKVNDKAGIEVSKTVYGECGC